MATGTANNDQQTNGGIMIKHTWTETNGGFEATAGDATARVAYPTRGNWRWEVKGPHWKASGASDTLQDAQSFCDAILKMTTASSGPVPELGS